MNLIYKSILKYFLQSSSALALLVVQWLLYAKRYIVHNIYIFFETKMGKRIDLCTIVELRILYPELN